MAMSNQLCINLSFFLLSEVERLISHSLTWCIVLNSFYGKVEREVRMQLVQLCLWLHNHVTSQSLPIHSHKYVDTYLWSSFMRFHTQMVQRSKSVTKRYDTIYRLNGYTASLSHKVAFCQFPITKMKSMNWKTQHNQNRDCDISYLLVLFFSFHVYPPFFIWPIKNFSQFPCSTRLVNDHDKWHTFRSLPNPSPGSQSIRWKWKTGKRPLHFGTKNRQHILDKSKTFFSHFQCLWPDIFMNRDTLTHGPSEPSTIKEGGKRKERERKGG